MKSSKRSRIVSRNVGSDVLEIGVRKSGDSKCGRCWRLLAEVPEDGALCRRCEEAVAQLDAVS